VATARAAAPIPSAATALGLRPGFVDDEIAVTEEAPVQHFDCFLGFLFGRHLHEPEAPGPAGELVGDDPDRLDGAGLGEELAKILLRGLEGQVTDEQLSGHPCDLLPTLHGRIRTLQSLCSARQSVTGGNACQVR